MADELKPCPFCGNDGTGPVQEALHISYCEPDWRGACWSVQCDKCTATMGYSDSEDEARDAWNRRAPADEIAALQARVTELEAENARLLKALQLISNNEFADHEFATFTDVMEFARAALKGETNDRA